MVNARDRCLAVRQALRNLLTRQIRQDAYSRGFNSTLQGEESED